MPRLRFGRFELLPLERQLLVDGNAAAVGARAFDLLLALTQRGGELVTKDQLIDQVWPDTVVEENNLQAQISALRKLLGPELIATIPGRGYRFTAPITAVDATPTVTVAPAATAVPTPPTADDSERPSIAVLPFANLGGEPDQEYFADGLAEDIVASLARSRWLFVVARNSSFGYRRSGLPFRDIARELGVRYLVAGSVRRAGDLLRVSAELVDAATDETVWTRRFDRPVADLFAVQDEISSTIASTIEPVFLRREETRAIAQPRRDLAHWQLLMQARWHFWRLTHAHVVEARRLLEQSLVVKPGDSASLALLAFTHLADAWGGQTEESLQAIDLAISLALEAVRNDDQDSHAHLVLGTALSCVGRFDEAIAELRRALDLYPHFAAAAGELGRLLAFAGRSDEALAMAASAIQSSPNDPNLSVWLRSQAIACFTAGRPAEAVVHAADATARRPDWFFNHYLLAACHVANSDLARARTAMAEAQRQMPNYSLSALMFGHPFVDPSHLLNFIAALRRAGWNG
jgi:TolB-like protein/Flp pilus assembly protein TadD